MLNSSDEKDNIGESSKESGVSNPVRDLMKIATGIETENSTPCSVAEQAQEIA